MRRLAREESGLVLIQALLLVAFMLALGVALVATGVAQQHESGHERSHESGFDIAEAALTAQASQLARAWPGATAPSSCNPSSTSSACPNAATIGGGYTGPAYGCATSSTPAWTTTVRDDAPGELYWTSAVDSRVPYDANGDGALWVKSTGVSACNAVSVVGLVSRTVTPIDFPNNVVSANWFSTSNQGRKVIVDTLGAYAQPPSIRPSSPAAKPARLSVRCTSLTSSQCLNYQADKGQVQPDTAGVDSSAPTSALGSDQLQAIEREAKAAGTFWAAGTCPAATANLTSVNGAPVVIQGPCNVSIGGGTQVNSAAAPGALIIENGTLTLGGSAIFYGLVYCVNQQGSVGSVVTITSNATIQGVVAVDGAGGVTAGASKTNLIYDPRATKLLHGDSGAALNRSSFRVLP